MKKAIVTGASSGIGQAIADRLLDEGYEVYGFGRDFSKSIFAKGDKAGFMPVVGDITDTGFLKERVVDININHDIDLLVHAAGVGHYGLHEELKTASIHELVATNIEAPIQLTNMLLRDLKKNAGTIAFISSVTAYGHNPHGAAYGASKAALGSFAHSIFDEGRKHGVRVLNIAPDMTATGLYRNADFTADTAEGACLFPKDIADAFVYALNARSGMVVNDIVVRPQLHRIKRKDK